MLEWSVKMEAKAKMEIQRQFDELMRKISDKAEHIRNDISDDDLRLICCFMSEIVKIASDEQPSK